MKLPPSLCETTKQQLKDNFIPEDIPLIQDCLCSVEDKTFAPTPLEALCFCPAPQEVRQPCIPTKVQETELLLLSNLLSLVKNKYCVIQV